MLVLKLRVKSPPNKNETFLKGKYYVGDLYSLKTTNLEYNFQLQDCQNCEINFK
jgi:hypothetical protein